MEKEESFFIGFFFLHICVTWWPTRQDSESECEWKVRFFWPFWLSNLCLFSLLLKDASLCLSWCVSRPTNVFGGEGEGRGDKWRSDASKITYRWHQRETAKTWRGEAFTIASLPHPQFDNWRFANATGTVKVFRQPFFLGSVSKVRRLSDTRWEEGREQRLFFIIKGCCKNEKEREREREREREWC